MTSAGHSNSQTLKEADVLRTILDYLRVHRVFHWRNHTAGGKLGNRFVRFGIPGAPDIFIVHRARCIGLEVKGPKGIQTPEQFAYSGNFRDAGGIYKVARSIEDVDQVLRYVERDKA